MDGPVENPIRPLHEMNSIEACYHCGNTIAENTHLNVELGGNVRPFCCSGCVAIAQTIHGEGLEVSRLGLAVSPTRGRFLYFLKRLFVAVRQIYPLAGLRKCTLD